ncbi:MAG TPA: erythromycin esterase family protein [Bacteroidales bacterium]|nr:erythromycin esterase family protein [Bacteroidales bacterium]
MLILNVLLFYSLTAQEKINFNREKSKYIDLVGQLSHPFNIDDAGTYSFIDKYIKDKKLIVLGEVTHSDASTIDAKTKLIEYLHKKFGFEVLILESNLYATKVVWDSIMNSDFHGSAFSEVLNRSGYISNDYCSFYDFIDTIKLKKIPFYISGLDCSYCSEKCYDDFAYHLIERLRKYDATSNFEIPNFPTLKSKSKINYNEKKLWAIECNNKLIEKLRQIQSNLNDSIEIKEIEFYIQVLISNNHLFEIKYSNVNEKIGDTPIWILDRDIQFFSNFEWLMKNIYEGKKIVISTSSNHALRNSYLNKDKEIIYAKRFGDYLSEKYGDDVYIISFITYNRLGPPKIYFGEAPKNSLEYIFHCIGDDYRFLDFHDQTGSAINIWENKVFKMQHFITDKYNPWNLHFDAVLFIDQMSVLDPLECIDAPVLFRNP